MNVRNSFLHLIILTIFIFSCGINPITGKKEFMLISETQEIELGKMTDQQILTTYGFYEEAELTAYVNTMGQDMAARSHRPKLQYHFKVLDTPVVNAFAAPGGYIYLTRGILAYLNNEAELAAVIGHELGHIAGRHSARNMTRATILQLGLGIGSALSEKIAEAAPYAQVGAQLLFLSFSRSDEYQADSLGVEYSTKAGYDSEKMADFFTSLQRMNPEASASGLPDWFSTHPNPDNRIEKVLKKSSRWKEEINLRSYKVNRNDLMAKIDNMIYGEDPRHGYVLKNMFYHPDMRFKFPVPSNWIVQNTPTQVVMADKENKAAIIFTLAEKNDLNTAAGNFSNTEGLNVLSSRPLIINGFNARQITSEMVSEEQSIKLHSSFIKKGELVFVFHALAGSADYNRYSSIFTRTSKNFSELKERRRINVKPATIRIARVGRAQSLKSFLTSKSVAASDLEKLAVMNGLNLADQLATGSLIKLIKE